MRDRLIELITEHIRATWHFNDSFAYFYEGVVPSLADYLLANGVIVPPCKVGDTVYIVENPYTFLPLKKSQEGTVISIHQHEFGLFIRVMFDTKKINGCADYNLGWKLGKTVFLTREEAEQVLAKMKGDMK